MTWRTALELIRRMDIDHQLEMARRPLTVVDMQHAQELLRHVRYEDMVARRRPRRRR
jgi:hypothetical protein